MRPEPLPTGSGQTLTQATRHYERARACSLQHRLVRRPFAQLQALEESSLNHQREAQAREATLRRTMEAMDQARADANMLRSRLQNANDALEQNRRNEQDAMASAHERDRQISALQKIVDEQAHDLDRSQAEARDAQLALERMRRAHADAQNTLAETQRRSSEEQVCLSSVVCCSFCFLHNPSCLILLGVREWNHAPRT